jgi:beta-glucanase (GH16 family)
VPDGTSQPGRRPTILAAVVLAALAADCAIAAEGNGRAPSLPPDDPLRQALEPVPSFAEEFDALSLWDGKRGTWRTVYGYGGINNRTLRPNGERQIYVDPSFAGTGDEPLGLDPFAIDDGMLHITATRVPPEVSAKMWDYPYASGLITTRRSFSQTYGYFEMRARLPEGKGLWPAFWLLPADGDWPPELDVMEMLGDDPTTIHLTVHTAASGKKKSRHREAEVEDASETFHVYGAWWGPTEVIWYIDGEEVARAPTPDDMHEPMYMLANLAVGGKWPGEPDDTVEFPAVMTVDYIRAFALR